MFPERLSRGYSHSASLLHGKNSGGDSGDRVFLYDSRPGGAGLYIVVGIVGLCKTKKPTEGSQLLSGQHTAF
jgi:hypothetical protein